MSSSASGSGGGSFAADAPLIAPASPAAGVTSLNALAGVLTETADSLIPLTSAGTNINQGQLIAANWTLGVCRVYAVDGVNGNDANVGFADPATSSAADYAIACAAAGAAGVAKKTLAGLGAVFPRQGRGRLVERAQRLGDTMLERLGALQRETTGIGDVRGRGAMVAIELVHDNGAPDAERAKRISAACHEQGVIVLTAGTLGNVVRLLPPLMLEDALLDQGLDALESAARA